MDDIASRPGLRQVFVTLTILRPERTTEDIQEMGLSALGSEYATYYDPDNVARTNNIEQAARIVDGTIIPAGATFSLNETLGPRTLDRGFDYAPVISDGVLRLGVGGGVCQFATTLFNAAFFAGLPIVERHPHSFYIEHYPVGRDAQVSWGSQDMKFKNDTDHSLMIRCWAKTGELTVVLVGDTGRTVEYTTTPFYNLRPSPYTKAHPRVIYDNELSTGIVTWESGYSGRSVKVVRTVTASDGKVLSRDTFYSTYPPKDWIKRIGTG
jgi:vancomycin resistance protein YoaR